MTGVCAIRAADAPARLRLASMAIGRAPPRRAGRACPPERVRASRLRTREPSRSNLLDTGKIGRYVPAPFSPGPRSPSLSPRRERSATRPGGRQRFADVAQPVEHRFCKPTVRGSIPLVSSGSASHPALTERSARQQRDSSIRNLQEGCPSGQREQTVNLPALPTLVRIQHPPRRPRWTPQGALPRPRGSSSVGRASAFQAERRRFESGLPLSPPPQYFNLTPPT